jgi:cytochrome c oxidase subunit II
LPSSSVPRRPYHRTPGLGLALSAGLLLGCEGRFSALDPASPQAQLIADLSWFMFVLSVGVMGLIVWLTAWALWRGRREQERPALNGMALVVGGGIVLPLIVLPVLWVLSLQAMAALQLPDEPFALEVDIHGRQFSYDVLYAENGIQLTDELRIPVGQPVLLRLHGEDVIHSFWVPRLGGKMDLIPGVTNETWIMAGQAGVYEGRCSEYCGIGHTFMGLTVIAQEQAEFEAWLNENGR